MNTSATSPAGPSLSGGMIIRYASDPVPPDCLCVLVGDGWGEETPQVFLTSLTDRDPATPGNACTTDQGRSVSAEVVNRSAGNTLTVLMPPGEFGMWAVQVQAAHGISAPFPINGAHLDWLSTDEAAPGETVRAFGRGLVGLEHYPQGAAGQPVSYAGYVVNHRTRVLLQDEGGQFHMVPVVRASGYDVHLCLPDDFAPGEYSVYLHNGHGGPYGWSAPLKLRVTLARPWPTTEFNVKEFGAQGDNATDNTEAVQRALDAAERNGGGVVVFPPGQYRFLGELRVPRYTVLRGTDRPRVWLYLPNGAAQGWGTPEQGMKIRVFIRGEGDFGLENLNIHGTYSPLLVAAPVKADFPADAQGWDDMLDAGRRADHVFVRNCRIVHEPTFDYHSRQPNDPVLVDERLTQTGKFWHWAAVAIRGEHLEVSDCDIKGAGMAVCFVGSRYSRLAHNTLRIGSYSNAWTFQPSGYTAGDPPTQQNIVEDNLIEPASNVNHAHAWLHGSVMRCYIARNDFQPIFWCCDNECLCFHNFLGRYIASVQQATASSVRLTGAGLADLYQRSKTSHKVVEDGALKPGALAGWECVIIKGRGLGQYRTIIDNTADTLSLASPWDVPPEAGGTVAFTQFPQFHGHLIVDNVIGDCGPGIMFWGGGFESIIDGNHTASNEGVNFWDLSRHYEGELDYWEFSGCYFNQALHNIVSEGRGYAKVGAFAGKLAYGVVGLVVRDNVTEQDSALIAKPSGTAPDGPNYVGVVFEGNLSRNNAVGIELHENVEVTLRRNRFENVDVPICGAGPRIRQLDK